MIKRLEIKNFQAHASSDLRLAPGLNVIVGPTDSGKTSVPRALWWLLHNRPLGTAFRSSWAKPSDPTSVVAELDDGTKLVRLRTDTKNIYSLQTTDRSEEYKAIGGEVPPTITAALAIDESAFQGQHDRHYLLSDNPGEVARKLNAIVGDLSLIDVALSRVRSMARANSEAIASEEATLAEHKARLQRLDVLRPASALAKQAGENLTKLRRSLESGKRLSQILIQHKAASDRFGEHNLRLARIPAGLASAAGALDEKDHRIKRLDQLLCGLKEAKQAESELARDLASARGSLPAVCPTCGAPIKDK